MVIRHSAVFQQMEFFQRKKKIRKEIINRTIVEQVAEPCILEMDLDFQMAYTKKHPIPTLTSQ